MEILKLSKMFQRLSFAENKETAISATKYFLRKLKAPVTTTAITETLQQHPDYPSLLSISDSLHRWKIDNICLRIDPEKLSELAPPFIAYLQAEGGIFIIVTGIKNDEVTYMNPAQSVKPISKTRTEFSKIWNGIVLVAEANDQSGEKDYKLSRRKEWLRQMVMPAIIISLLLVIVIRALFVPASLLLPALLLPLIKFIGCIVTALLLWYEIDQGNQMLKSICTGGKNINCQAVLQSKEAKLFGWLSWSEIGFFYFTGSFLFILLSGYAASALAPLAWLNLFALPYTLFSVYYQWRIAKQWCLLCLTVQGLLLIEALVFYVSFWNQPSSHALFLTGYATFILITSFLLPVLFWVFAKPFFVKAQDGKSDKKELAKLKHNAQIFDALLHKQKTIQHNPEGLGIILGNPAASNTLIKVCNPYCGPCARAHASLEELLKQNEDLKVQIIFSVTDDEKDFRSKPVKHFMALSEKNDKQFLQQALDDWYLAEEKDYDKFSAKYPMNGELQFQNAKLKAMSDWCNETEIVATPTIFINGYQLPSIYSINDLQYFLTV